MELFFKSEDEKSFLEKIGYKVEKVIVKYTEDSGRGCDDEDHEKTMYIAYKGNKPDTNAGYNFYQFKIDYEMSRIFNKEFPSYLVKNITNNI